MTDAIRPHYIFSTEGTAFHDWQSEVLVHSHRRSGLGGRITRLVSCDAAWQPQERSNSDCAVVRVPRFDPLNGDGYPLRNRPHSLVHLFEQWPGYIDPDEIVVLLDPDQVLVGSPGSWHALLERVAAQGPVAAGYGIGSSFLDRWADPFCDGLCSKADEAVRSNIAIGAPYILRGRDLQAIAPVWVEVMERIRRDAPVANIAGWCTDMYAYAIATIRLGIPHIRLPLMISSPFDGNEPWDLVSVDAEGRPHFQSPLVVVHYCQKLSIGSYSWSKHDHHEFAMRDRSVRPLFPIVSHPADIEVLQQLTAALAADARLLEPRGLLESRELPRDVAQARREEARLRAEAYRSVFLYHAVVPFANEALRACYASTPG
ncbi:MAG: hypothetical protein AB7Q29_10365 [Vicinamibacterales bacterium]